MLFEKALRKEKEMIKIGGRKVQVLSRASENKLHLVLGEVSLADHLEKQLSKIKTRDTLKNLTILNC